ncbi:hypothetical protein HPB48_003042 [Haemaphysalis longicornis]|uniref:Uncharacterized protein n=1 Tax=Haemaphysalis longicornis TaxID=44386 RepID=A0A9J6FQ14_HAELO|nr:hypothetical protein HPB48_003042 [Haemaphysalis longicornis]
MSTFVHTQVCDTTTGNGAVQKGHCGYDFWFNQDLLESASGVYSMDIFLSRATTVIRDHDISEVGELEELR